MASLGHIAVGIAASRHAALAQPRLSNRLVVMVLFALIAYLPDLDVIGYWCGIPYASPFGHRGATHSLVFALLMGMLLGRMGKAIGVSYRRMAFISLLLLVSHGSLDALTNGGKGVEFFWPFNEQRYFFPWRPIPVAEISFRLSHYQRHVLFVEFLYSLPLLVYGCWGLWSFRKRSS
jgi:inner membrane protein